MGASLALDQIALPVAGDGAVGCIGWALADRDRVDDLALATVLALGGARAAQALSATQVADQLAPQRPPRAWMNRVR